MKRNNYLFYKDYLKNRNLINKEILVSKFSNSYLIGPLINDNFDEESFYKRILSNSIYSPKVYKKTFFRKTIELLIDKYKDTLQDNEVIELLNNGKIIVHKIIKVPGEYDERKQVNTR